MFIEALNLLLEQLFDHLKHEAIILSVDEEEEIKSLQREVQLIESYLRDMDEIQRQATLSHVQKTKLQHLMQDLHEIEDVLDNWIYQKVQQAHQSPSKKFKAFFNRTLDSLIRKGNLVKKVVELRERLGKTLQRPENYQLPNNYSQVAYTRRRPRTNPFLAKDEIIVGIKEDVETLVAKFLRKDSEPEANLAIVGMGGSGKTTLAKMFYNHQAIKEAFPNRRAWVCVSQEWNAHDLLLQICAMLGVSLSEDEKSIPHIKLQQFLEKGACLVVLDDVWEKNALQELLPTLLSENGRVLITTRKEKVVKFPRIGAFYLHRARRDSTEHIGNMVLLRSLRFVNCYYQIENLYFIKKLRNLEILVICNYSRDSSVIPKLADKMCDCMEQLRVILLAAENGFAEDPSLALSGVANLKNLETLAQDPVCQGLVKELEASGNDNLRVLKLYQISGQPHLDAICVCVGNNLPHLEILWLQLDYQQSGVGFDLQKMKWGSCKLLKEIIFRGKIIIKQHESWLCPPKLMSLSLSRTEIKEEEDMNKYLAGLDHLRELVHGG